MSFSQCQHSVMCRAGKLATCWNPWRGIFPATADQCRWRGGPNSSTCTGRNISHWKWKRRISRLPYPSNLCKMLIDFLMLHLQLLITLAVPPWGYLSQYLKISLCPQDCVSMTVKSSSVQRLWGRCANAVAALTWSQSSLVCLMLHRDGFLQTNEHAIPAEVPE